MGSAEELNKVMRVKNDSEFFRDFVAKKEKRAVLEIRSPKHLIKIR
jgi:ribosomal protein L24E